MYSHAERIGGSSCQCHRAYFYAKKEAYKHSSIAIAGSLMNTLASVRNHVLPNARFISIVYEPNKELMGEGMPLGFIEFDDVYGYWILEVADGYSYELVDLMTKIRLFQKAEAIQGAEAELVINRFMRAHPNLSRAKVEEAYWFDMPRSRYHSGSVRDKVLELQGLETG